MVEPDGTKGTSFCSEVNPNNHLKLPSTQVGLEVSEHGQGIRIPTCPTQNCKANVMRPELICYYHLMTWSPKQGVQREVQNCDEKHGNLLTLILTEHYGEPNLFPAAALLALRRPDWTGTHRDMFTRGAFKQRGPNDSSPALPGAHSPLTSQAMAYTTKKELFSHLAEVGTLCRHSPFGPFSPHA